MALSTSAIKPKKKRTAVVLGCDQCRRRKTKCDQGRPTCGPCLYAGLMECTFLLGKTPASKRKKPTSEVEVLEARLETIESKYSERLRTMETLLSKVMPTPGGQDMTKNDQGASTSGSSVAVSSIGTQGMMIDTYTNNDDGWQDISSPLEKSSPYIPNWDRNFDMVMLIDTACYARVRQKPIKPTEQKMKRRGLWISSLHFLSSSF
ncbi:MAG: hypothetical protein BYD32DRAFT_62650 [Podila humilis]|nr:MAG: hypothetical protein BYD32DRAFT_62650 [Podila humilis]